VKVGLVGLGYWGPNLARNFDDLADLAWLCDLSEENRATFAGRYPGARLTADFDEVLASDVSAVVIATPVPTHYELAKRALEAGKHVLVEKPMGVDVEECEDLRERVLASRLVLQVGTEKRFDPGIAFAHRFIREQMGEMLALKAWYCDSLYRYAMTDTLQPIPLTSGKARRPEDDPKADRRRYSVMAHGSHLLDTARFLGGEIDSIRARLVEKFGARCWFAEAEFADGSAGHLDLTIAVRMDWHEGFQVYGEYGSVIGKTYNPWYLKSSDVECFTTRDGQYHRPLGEDAHFFRLQVEGFADRVLRGVRTLGADVDDGLAAVRGLVALARSAESGKKVLLSEAEGGV
jgi:predicted dehydrogenase